MKIETYIITWNREDTIALTLKHYLRFGRVFLYDNFSDDRTREIASEMGADVRLFGAAGVLDDGVYLDIKNRAWKGSKADWVIVVDDDEILYHPDLMMKLEEVAREGFTIIKPQGWGMFSEKLPKGEWTEVMTGVKDDNYSKLCCFNPKFVTDIRYVYGCHEANPRGLVRTYYGLNLLHYWGVGGAERLIKRHLEYEPRRQRSRVNMRWNLGHRYGETAKNPDNTRKWFSDNLKRSSALSF